MPKLLIDVCQRIKHLERRRSSLWASVNGRMSDARVYHGHADRQGERYAALLAEAAIAKAQAQCLTVEIYALRAMVGLSAQDIRR
jgi:hypothetical protein